MRFRSADISGTVNSPNEMEHADGGKDSDWKRRVRSGFESHNYEFPSNSAMRPEIRSPFRVWLRESAFEAMGIFEAQR